MNYMNPCSAAVVLRKKIPFMIYIAISKKCVSSFSSFFDVNEILTHKLSHLVLFKLHTLPNLPVW